MIGDQIVVTHDDIVLLGGAVEAFEGVGIPVAGHVNDEIAQFGAFFRHAQHPIRKLHHVHEGGYHL